MNMNGTPSNRMLKNEIEKSCKLNVNQLIIRYPERPRVMDAAQAMGPRGRKCNGGVSLNSLNRGQAVPPNASSDDGRGVLKHMST
jgi:hypothetical protein